MFREDLVEDLNSESEPFSLIPTPEVFPPIYNPNLAEIHHLDSVATQQFREQEITNLAEKINQLPAADFDTMRETELDRLGPYLDAFAELFGVDLRAVMMTRTQMTQTVMLSSPLLIQTMFDEVATYEKDKIFFDSRREAGGFHFNANGTMALKDIGVVFSVLKRNLNDGQDYEVDYPAFSLPREVFELWQSWQNHLKPGSTLQESPIINLTSKIQSLRIHDWIHAAILYDTQSLTQIFADWSNNSYFVQHDHDDPGRINYELLSNRIHFAVWQHIFSKDTQAKKSVVADLKEYFWQIDHMVEWGKNQDPPPPNLEAIAQFLAYFALKSIVYVVRYDNDKDLLQTMADVPRFAQAFQNFLSDEKSTAFSDSVYQTEELLAFRQGTDKKLPMIEILTEYFSGLREEAREVRSRTTITAILQDVETPGRPKLTHEFLSLPSPVLEQLKTQAIDKYDPQLFRQLNVAVEQLRAEHGSELVEAILKRIEVDAEGFFYLQAQRDEVAFDQAEKVTQQKHAILMQVPYSITEGVNTRVTTSLGVLSTQVQAEALAKPGEVIIINTENAPLAEQLLSKCRKTDGSCDIDMLLALIHQYSQKGLISFNDVYPIDSGKVSLTFGLASKGVAEWQDEKLMIKAGYYQTLPNVRQAVRSGPLSLDVAGQDASHRRRVIQGAAVQNHVQNGNHDYDVFPVDARALRQFYGGVNHKELPFMQLTPVALGRLLPSTEAAPADTLIKINKAWQSLSEVLEEINVVQAYGFRGKPKSVTFGEVMAKGAVKKTDEYLNAPEGT